MERSIRFTDSEQAVLRPSLEDTHAMVVAFAGLLEPVLVEESCFHLLAGLGGPLRVLQGSTDAMVLIEAFERRKGLSRATAEALRDRLEEVTNFPVCLPGGLQ